MMKPETKENLTRLIGMIDTKIAAIKAEIGPRPDWFKCSYAERDAYHRRERAAEQKVIQELTAEEGAVISLTGAHEHTIRLAGVRSTCTSGWQGLLHNWQNAARRRIEKETAS